MEMRIIRLADLAGTPRPRSSVGGKAHYLAQLYAAGLPVPDALVVTTAVQGLEPEERARVLAELAGMAAELGSLLAVRSSAVMEDDIAAAAPGVFATVLGVPPAAVAEAVQAVWDSARTPLVRAYAAARGVAEPAVAVIVQRQVPGEPAEPHGHGVVYTRLPGQPGADEALIEVHLGADRAPLTARIPRVGPADVAGAPWPASVTAAVRDLALGAEDAIGARRGADVEWVVAGERIWLVQARPIIHPEARPPAAFPEALLAFSRAEPEVVWRLDVTHNPEPLSPAQASLVERMEDAGLAPYRMRVVGGYLYVASSGAAPREVPEASDAASLRRRFDEELVPAMNAALAPAEAAAAAADLPAVLAAYERFYGIYAAELTPALSAARRALPAFLGRLGLDGERIASELLADGSPARLESLLARVARGDMTMDALLAEVGAMAPAWDVACPTFAETPEIVRGAVARAAGQVGTHVRVAAERAREVRAGLGLHDVARFDELLELARAARDIAELDDRHYARAQAAVRRALVRLAAQWSVAAADIVFVPLETILELLAHGHAPDPILVHRRAQAGRAAHQRQRGWSMPLAFAGGRALDERDLGHGPGVWRGLGTGGRVRGAAVRLDDLAAPPPIEAGAIVVTLTVTPAMAFALQGAGAIVAEHGGLLDHGAAMARELGIPCVVRCARAWAEIRTGDILWIDGDAGLVIRADTPG